MENNWRRHLTDIHMHIVPGVDDGAGSLKEALTELKMSIEQGVDTVIVTPHSHAFEDHGEEVFRRFELLNQKAADYNYPVSLYLGCEVLCFPYDMDITIERLKRGEYPTMAGTDYVLTEFTPGEHTEEDAISCIDSLVSASYKPVIAHVERYDFTTVPGVVKMKEHGAMIQINAYSVVNEPKASTRENANALLKEHLVDFIGPDAHRLNHRPPTIKDGADAIIEMYGEEYARKVLMDNTKRLILGV